MAVGDVYKLEFFHHAHDRQFINVYYYQEQEAASITDAAQDLADAWIAEFLPGLREVYSDQTTFGSLKVGRIVGGDQKSWVQYFVDTVGARPTESLPGNTGIRINLKGTRWDRPSKGALILSGLAEGAIEQNRVTVTTQDIIQENLIDKLEQPLEAVGPALGEWVFGYMSRSNQTAGGELQPWPGEFVEPDEINLQTIPVTIRSRESTHQNRASLLTGP